MFFTNNQPKSANTTVRDSEINYENRSDGQGFVLCHKLNDIGASRFKKNSAIKVTIMW